MRKSKKIIALLLGTSMIATCFSACGKGSNSNSDSEDARIIHEDVKKVNTLGIPMPEAVSDNDDAQKIKLKVWCPSEEQDITKQLCEIYDDSDPEFDIEFEIGVVSEADAKTQLTTDVDAAADVFMFAGDQLTEMVEGNFMSQINDSIAAEVKDTQIEQAYNACSVNDALYAVPFTANLWYMFYNKSMYTEEEVKSLDTMFEKDLGSDVDNFAIDIANGWFLAGFFYAGGCTLYGPDGTDPKSCDWAEDKGIAVVDYLNEKVATGKLHKDDSYDSIPLLQEGKVAAYCTGSWNAKAIKDALGENYAAACAPQITVNGTTEYIKPFADFKMIGVKATTENPKAAQKLAQFLGGDYAQAVRLQTREVQPTVKALVENVPEGVDYQKDYPAVYASLEQMKHTVNRPSISQISKYWSPAGALGGYIYKQKEEVTGDGRQAFVADKVVAKICG